MEELTNQPENNQEQNMQDHAEDQSILSEMENMENANVEQRKDEVSLDAVSLNETDVQQRTEEENDIVVNETHVTAEEERHIEGLSREDLLKELKNILATKKYVEAKQLIALIKLNFINKTKVYKKELQEKFIADGGILEEFKPEEDALEETFFKVNNEIKKEIQKIKDELEKEKAANLEKKKGVLEKLRQLIDSEEDLKTTYDEFKKLQEAWKEIGQVSRNEINNLWNTYHFLVEKFFEKVKINKELRDLDMKKNLEAKIELCEKAEELLIEPSLNKSFKLLQQYHEQWREIGPVALDKKDEIWERFKTASDKINLKRKEYYEQIQGEQEKNLLAKTALCEKVEELLSNQPNSIKTWNESTQEIEEHVKLWKTIGRAAPAQNEEIWERFKGKINDFFNLKKEYFKKIKEEQLHNYNLKLDLCVQAEAIANSTDWKQTTQELLKLQQDWKEIGQVPLKQSEKIWKRFRSACDTFFDAKAEYFKSARENEASNLEAKEKLIEEIKNMAFGEDKSENLQKIKDLQRRWMEIGFIPMKDKERVQTAYRTAVNEVLDKLNISYKDIRVNDSGKPNSYSSVDSNKKEGGSWHGRINQLKEDLALWENNINFFSKSKNADVLRAEVEQKIKKAKQELALLEAKLKKSKEPKIETVAVPDEVKEETAAVENSTEIQAEAE